LQSGYPGDDGRRPAGSPEEAERPNVIFILADDLDARSIAHMPALQSLMVEEGTTFENAFVTHSLCCPSRVSILTGQHSHNHKVETNTQPRGGFGKFRSEGHEESNVATWLHDGGYQTVLIGKYLNKYPPKDKTYVPPGWDEWYGRIGPIAYYDYRLNENGKVVSHGDDESDYFTDVVARHATDYIRRKADDERPFFMYLAPGAPHDPYTPARRHEGEFAGERAPRPPSFDEADVSDKPGWVSKRPSLGSRQIANIDEKYRKRLESLLAVDGMLAGMIEELRTSRQLENTYVVFTSDHGYHLGEHRLGTGKRTAYEESIRVPLVARGPGVPADEPRRQFALNIDFAPTFADLAGVPTPRSVDGRSLAPLLTDEPPATWRSAFLVEYRKYNGPGYMGKIPGYKAVRTHEHKYVEYANGDRELYDLFADPYELENLHGSVGPALEERLQTRLDELRGCAGDGCREGETAP